MFYQYRLVSLSTLLLFQCVPYLISMCTDTEKAIRVKADQQLQEIDKKYPGFIHVSSLGGKQQSLLLYKCCALSLSLSATCIFSVGVNIWELHKLFVILQMKALQGLKMSYKLQQLLQSNSTSCVIRGHRDNEGNMISLNNFLYTVLRSNRSHRRAILLSLLNLFDDSAVSVTCYRMFFYCKAWK